MSTLSGGLSYASGVIGGGAVGAILTVALTPFITLLSIRFCFFIAGSLCEVMGCRVTAGFISGFSKAYDTLVAVYTFSVIIYIYEIILFLKSGVLTV